MISPLSASPTPLQKIFRNFYIDIVHYECTDAAS